MSILDEINSSLLDEINGSLLDVNGSLLDEINGVQIGRYVLYETNDDQIIDDQIIDSAPVVGIPCFLKGTKILTDDGEKPVEKLLRGTHLINHEGKKIKLLDIYSFKTSKNNQTHPCLIQKGTIIDNNKCNDDLYISQEHCLLVQNIFVPAKKIIRPKKIKDYNDYYFYYHLVTENFFTDAVISNGIITETYGKCIKQKIGKDVYNYLKKKIIHNGNRILLNNYEFNNLIDKYLTMKKIKKINNNFC
jgi:hypothetical protein